MAPAGCSIASVSLRCSVAVSGDHRGDVDAAHLPYAGWVPGRALPTWPVAAAALIAGFGVAELTGVRAIGGVVLFVGALWCGLRWKAARGLAVALGLVAVFLLAFALSHVLGRQIGSWPAVFVVSAVVALSAWAAVDRRELPHLEDAV